MLSFDRHSGQKRRDDDHRFLELCDTSPAIEVTESPISNGRRVLASKNSEVESPDGV